MQKEINLYKINYFCHTNKVLCYFDNYEICKKSLETLKERYRENQIWMDEVEVIECYQKFIDKTNGLIEDYER